jgi:hypothetical protein
VLPLLAKRVSARARLTTLELVHLESLGISHRTLVPWRFGSAPHALSRVQVCYARPDVLSTPGRPIICRPTFPCAAVAVGAMAEGASGALGTATTYRARVTRG